MANGVTIESAAQFDFHAVAKSKLTNGTVFTPISNTASTPINGTFVNLPTVEPLPSGGIPSKPTTKAAMATI